MSTQLEKVLAYLDSVQSLYPSGIEPSDGGVESCGNRKDKPGFVSWGNKSARLRFAAVAARWLVDSEGRPFSGENGKLLLGIIEKGLGLGAREVHVSGFSLEKEDELPEELDRLRRCIEPVEGQILLVLGATAARGLGLDTLDFAERRGKLFAFGKGQAVLLYGLDEIRDNIGLKKEFWEDLKGLVKRLNK